jgi:hypothetical protein
MQKYASEYTWVKIVNFQKTFVCAYDEIRMEIHFVQTEKFFGSL